MSQNKDLGVRPPEQVGSGLPSPEHTPRDGKVTPAARVRSIVFGPAGRYLLVGGVSFALDFFLLVFLHEYFGVDLLLATPIAFLASLAANYLLSRFFTFAGTGARGSSFVKYAALVVFNTVAASLIVSGFEAVGSSYMLGKVASTALMTVWNYFAYKYWVFAQKQAPQDT